jgi:hypothetical protein
VFETGQGLAIDGEELAQQGFADDQHARAAVGERVAIVLCAPQGVERHWHGADLDRAEERVGERRRVLEDQGDPLFGLDAERAQRRPETIDPFGDLLIADALITALDGDRGAAPFGEVAIDEMGGGVELLRQGHAGSFITTRAAASCRDTPGGRGPGS